MYSIYSFALHIVLICSVWFWRFCGLHWAQITCALVFPHIQELFPYSHTQTYHMRRSPCARYFSTKKADRIPTLAPAFRWFRLLHRWQDPCTNAWINVKSHHTIIIYHIFFCCYCRCHCHWHCLCVCVAMIFDITSVMVALYPLENQHWTWQFPQSTSIYTNHVPAKNVACSHVLSVTSFDPLW